MTLIFFLFLSTDPYVSYPYVSYCVYLTNTASVKKFLIIQVSLKVAREEHQKQELLHLQDKEQLSERLHEKDVQYQDLLRDTKLKHTEELESLRVSFENRQRETEKRYSIRFASLRTELHLRLKSEVRVGEFDRSVAYVKDSLITTWAEMSFRGVDHRSRTFLWSHL